MGLALALIAYVAYAIFVGRVGRRIFSLWRAGPGSRENVLSSSRTVWNTIRLLVKAMVDIFSLSRLFRVDRRLWTGEWVFHCTFRLVMLRHLRCVADPLPKRIGTIRPIGVCAGHVLVFALLFICVCKLLIERKSYLLSYNFSLLGVLFLISMSGILMSVVTKPDLSVIKSFMMGVFTFKPHLAPGSPLFLVHFLLAMLFSACLPTHIFAAPFSTIDARRREKGLRLVMHEK